MKVQGFLIAFTGAVLFSTKAILVKLAFRHTQTDGVTLLALRMLLSLPFYLLTALWGSRQAGNMRMKPRQWWWVISRCSSIRCCSGSGLAGCKCWPWR